MRLASAFLALPRAVAVRFVAWTVFMAAVAFAFTFDALPNLRIETDILALLPKTEGDAALDEALDVFSAKLARRQLFLVGAGDADIAKAAARAFANELRNAQAFAHVDLEIDDAGERFNIYARHPSLLAKADLRALQAGKIDALAQSAIRAAFTPAGLVQIVPFTHDPLGFVNRFLQAQTFSLGRAMLDGDVLTIRRDDRVYVLLSAEANGSPFAAAVQERVMPAIAQAIDAARRQGASEILSSGAIQHAAAATERAKFEISTFGTLELIAVILLLWIILGALRPLFLASVTLAFATLTALTAVHYLFGTVHILALVFGSSLIGGVIDYSIHFFADRFRAPDTWTPVAALRHVGGAILLGLTTTLIGYVVLALVPFPGLTQIAVFCAVGLATGCGCVLCWYPLLAQPRARPAPRAGARLGTWLNGYLSNWRWSRVRVIVASVAGVLLAVGLMRAHSQDDIRALQESPAILVEQEARVRELLGSGVETRYFVVSGPSEQAVLETEERLAAKLDMLIAQGALSSYQAITQSVPSYATQATARALLAEKVYAPNGLLERVMSTLGFPPAAIQRRQQEFEIATAPLSLQAWRQSPAADGARHLWLDQIGERFASVVMLGGIRDVAALTSIDLGTIELGNIEQGNVRLIDRVAGTSEILSRYREVLALLLAMIYLVAGLVLTIRFGWTSALRILLPSALATTATLGLFGWLGVPINLFTLLGLWLVLGLGIDYGIFLRHAQATDDPASRSTAILSVTLSACTTVLAFGPLSFSATPFIRSIGLTLLCAIMFSWAFVLLSCAASRPSAIRG